MSINPGRDVQRVGTAAFLGEDVGKIHDPVWAVIGNLGDSQCYLGVPEKVQAVQAALHRRIAEDDLARPPHPARVHAGRLGRPAQRHAADAVLTRRPRARPRRGRRAPGGERRGGPRRRRRVRQAPGRDRRRRAREQHAGGDPVRRPDQARHRPRDGWPDRPRVGLPGGRPGRRGARPVRAARLPRPGQLRGHVHLQHHADLHRGPRARAAAHGVPAVGRPAPADRVPRPDGRLPARHGGAGHPAARHRRPLRRCATRSPSPSPWAAPPTCCCTASRSPAPPASTSGTRC